MKKIISTLLAICMLVPLNVSVLATQNVVETSSIVQTDTESNLGVSQQLDPYEPLNPNFKKTVTFSEEEIDLEYLGIADWCREDFIHLYELGFTELAEEQMARDGLIPGCYYSLVTNTFYKFLKIYNGESTELSWVVSYLEEQGVLKPGESKFVFFNHNEWENTIKNNANFSLADSFQRPCNINRKNNSLYRHAIQVIISRLLGVVDIGNPINSLTSITDINEGDSDRLDFENILELYNYGIFTGNERGMFNAYDCMSLNEFVTVMARICFPNRRVKINEEEYYAKANLPVETIQTYNSIDEYWFKKIKDLTNVSSLYIEESYDDRIISTGEALYILYYVSIGKWPLDISSALEKNLGKKYTLPLASASPECYEIYDDYIRDLELGKQFYVDNFLSDDEIQKEVSKKTLALIFMKFAEQIFKVFPQTKITLNPSVTVGLDEEELHLLSGAVGLGLIENTIEDFTQATITQTEFEKMLVQFAMKFSTVIPQNSGVTRDRRINLITDYSLLPSNAELFPYITDILPKEFYESLDLSKADFGYHSAEAYLEAHLSPYGLYTIHHNNYVLSEQRIKGYFNAILNIDYRTITLESFIEKIDPYLYISLNSSYGAAYKQNVENYVNYIKKNKIIIKGNILPDFSYLYYFDNLLSPRYLLGCKIQFEVINSEIENPILLFTHLEKEFYTDANDPSIKYASISVLPITYLSSTDGVVFKVYGMPSITE